MEGGFEGHFLCFKKNWKMDSNDVKVFAFDVKILNIKKGKYCQTIFGTCFIYMIVYGSSYIIKTLSNIYFHIFV